MLRPTGARFPVCARVLMTSLAANNILPLRIGDVMRVFTYAGDIGASPSVLLSTVILEKLLDIFILVLLFVRFMGPNVSHHSRILAESLLAISTIGLLVLLLGARTLERPLRSLFDSLPRSPSSPRSSTGSPSPSTASGRSASPAPSFCSSSPPSSGSARA